MTYEEFIAPPREQKHDDEWWNNLPPMPPDMRTAFDKVVESMYRPGCGCLAFLFRGTIRTVKLPLEPQDRWLIASGIREGWIIPLGPDGQGL